MFAGEGVPGVPTHLRGEGETIVGGVCQASEHQRDESRKGSRDHHVVSEGQICKRVE